MDGGIEVAEKKNYGLIDLLMDKYNIDYTYYDLEKKTGIKSTTFQTANKKSFESYTGYIQNALAFYCNVNLGQLVNDLYEIDLVFYSNLDTIEEDLIKNHEEGATYQELKEILPEIVKHVAKTEVESKTYMSHLNKFIKQFKN